MLPEPTLGETARLPRDEMTWPHASATTALRVLANISRADASSAAEGSAQAAEEARRRRNAAGAAAFHTGQTIVSVSLTRNGFCFRPEQRARRPFRTLCPSVAFAGDADFPLQGGFASRRSAQCLVGLDELSDGQAIGGFAGGDGDVRAVQPIPSGW